MLASQKKPTKENCKVGTYVVMTDYYDWAAGKMGQIVEIRQLFTNYDTYRIKLSGISMDHLFNTSEFLVLG